MKPPQYFKRPGIVTFGINNGGHYWRPDIVSLQDSTHRFNRSLWLDGRITKLVPMQNRGGQFYGLDGYSGGHIKYCPNVIFHSRSSGMQVDRWLDMDSVCWGDGRDSRNSFIAVIHLCYLLGFTRLYLWGCDFKMNKENPYFFSESKNAGSVIRNNRMFGHTNEMLTVARPYIEAHGMTIYNCTPDSGLTAFDYMPIDKAVKKEQLEIRDDCKGLYHRGRPSARPTVVEPKGNRLQNYTVVAYYSKGTPYRYEAERLRDSLQLLGIDYYIRPVRVQGWQAATNYKPTFLLETLKKLKRPILYVDADAIFHRFPECNYDCDIAVWWATKNKNELRSGTIWLNYSDAAFDILEKWQEQCKNHPQKWDQTNLRDVLVKGDWNVIKLPDSMCKIFDRQHNCKDPYIEHFQASRRLKS